MVIGGGITGIGGAGWWGKGEDVCVIEGGGGAAGKAGEGVGRCEEEGGAEAVVGVGGD